MSTITINTKSFSLALKRATKFLSKRSTLPILGTVHLTKVGDVCTIQSNNLDNLFTTQFEATGDDTDICLTNVKGVFQNISKAKVATFTLETTNDYHAILMIGNQRMIVNTLDSADFPVSFRGEQNQTREYPLTKENIQEIITSYSHVKCALSDDDARPILTGVHFDGEGMMGAADGFQLALTEYGTKFPKFTCSPSLLENLDWFSGQEAYLDLYGDVTNPGTIACIRNNTMQLWAECPIGDYPNLRQIVPTDRMEKDHEAYYVSKREMVEGLTSLLQAIPNGNMVCKFDKGVLSMHSEEGGDALYSLSGAGENYGAIVYAFNVKFMLKLFKTFVQTDKALIHIFYPAAPIYITEDPEQSLISGLALLMPMHLENPDPPKDDKQPYADNNDGQPY